MRRWKYWAYAVALLGGPVSARAAENIVHEWGIFTCLQDENGKSIGGINIQDVPVAETLEKIAPGSLLPVTENGDTTPEEARCHSQVTMRLEKAALNFYPASRIDGRVDVDIECREGWLTQFSPDAIATTIGFSRDHIGSLTLAYENTLEWKDIILQGPGDDLTADSELISNGDEPKRARIDVKGQQTDSIIYRGVLTKTSLLRVVRSGPELVITSTYKGQLVLPQLWLMELNARGETSVRLLRPFNEEAAFLVKTPGQFSAEEAVSGCIDKLKSDLKVTVRRAGLFEAEADELVDALATAHFRKVGVRLFFVLPANWKGPYWGLRASSWNGKGKRQNFGAVRVLVGCIEIVTPEQRALLTRIASGDKDRSVTGIPVKPELLLEEQWNEFREMYDWLGQFGNALLLDEQRRRPSPFLEAFIRRFHLEGYTPKALSQRDRLMLKPQRVR